MRVQVLMSTYNGEKYVEQQIRSISQNANIDTNIELLIRDDGSSDKTVEIIKSLTGKLDISVKLVQGENLGVSKSFLELIKRAPEAELYFLCDQDDVWAPNKIQSFVASSIDSEQIPQLFASGYYLTDSKLNVIKECGFEKTTQNTLLQILFANMVPGCTMAFNMALMQELRKNIPLNVPMHDIYILATAYCVGKIHYINEPLVYYRQHEKNTEGVQSVKIDIKKILRKQKKMLLQKHSYTAETASNIYHKYQEELFSEELKKLRLVMQYRTNFIAKLCLLKEKEIYYHNIRSGILTVEKILLNKF